MINRGEAILIISMMVLSIIGMAIAYMVAYSISVGIVNMMNPKVASYDPRNDPMCDPVTGELKPDACEGAYSSWDRPRVCFSQCNIPRGSAISNVSISIRWTNSTETGFNHTMMAVFS